jgi:NAD-reducing hydrogenase large subunit
MQTITIHPVSRIEGHARITIHLDDGGEVTGTQLHVTQVRGFEKFTEGRPFYEMPSITARICGICPVSHLLASSKACDAIMAVTIPDTAAKLRELIHCAQFVQSHALSFFHLSAPDLLLGMDFDPLRRNVAGLLEEHPEALRDGIALRRFGQQVIERLAGERIHPSWVVPGGVRSPLDASDHAKIVEGLPEAMTIVRRTLEMWKGVLDRYSEEAAAFGNHPTLYAGLVDPAGGLQLYDGRIRFGGPSGEIVADQLPADSYAAHLAEATLPDSYMKAPYYRAHGYPEGVYRVGALARLNVVDRCGTPEADAELAEYRQRLGRTVQSAFHYHYARLVESLYALERISVLLDDPGILGRHVRATAGVNNLEGIGVIEAPRGLLIHHYRVHEDSTISWANLIVATGHNNLAMGKGVEQVARRFVKAAKLEEGMLNRVSALVRAYDPCLSCATHAVGGTALRIELRDAEGTLLDELETPASPPRHRLGR